MVLLGSVDTSRCEAGSWTEDRLEKSSPEYFVPETVSHGDPMPMGEIILRTGVEEKQRQVIDSADAAPHLLVGREVE